MGNQPEQIIIPSTKPVITKPIASIHSFYISGTIEESSEYIQWFETMRNAGELDVIKFHINSYGGDLFTAIQFLRAMADTEAHVICSVEGACMSAATMIFLAGDSFEVSEHSVFMFHNYSGGTIGKGGEMIDQLVHERRWSEHLLKRIYAEFLSEDEVTSLLNNKDIWMDGEEVLKRLSARQQKFEKLAAQLQKEAAKPVAVKTPVKKPAAKKAPIKK